MAKLRITRGETAHGEFDLRGGTVRIGRGAENEIVLEDPGKGVSRTHAMLRFEADRYILVDNHSQNGIWVAGARVPSVVMAPGVVAAVGPFRLTVETTADEPTAIVTSRHLEDLPPLAGTAPPLPEDGGHVPDAPAPPPLAGGAVQPSRRRQKPPAWAIAGGALALLAASGLAIYAVWLMRNPRFDLVAAEALAKSGRCQEAMDRHIAVALRVDPADANALRLRDFCTPPVPGTGDPEPQVPPPPPGPIAADLLVEAEALIAAKQCQAAVERVAQALALEPANPLAIQLSERAKTCPGQPPGPVTTGTPAVQRPPSEGGLNVLPKEQEKEYRLRMGIMRARYDSAVAALNRGEHARAREELELIAREVPEGYLDLADKRAAVQQAIKGDAQTRIAAARASEAKFEFEVAAEAYRQAHALDPEIDIAPHLQRLEATKLARGLERCKAAGLEYSYRNYAAAIPAYEEALRLLPSTDPCYGRAQERLKLMGK